MAPDVGPHPGVIKVSRQYYFEHLIHRKMSKPGVDPAREEDYRLKGAQLIYELKQELLLPAKTYSAACVFYHRFRLKHISGQHNWRDAAIACLFLACKTEDTLKKAREIICANYNMKNADKKIPDDKQFDAPHKVVIGLERLVIEATHFDFRARNPHDVLVKVVKRILPDKQDGHAFFPAAFQVSLDMHKTYAPIKQTSHTMALAVCELTALLTGLHVEKFQNLDPTANYTDRVSVTETMLDILDLYENHQHLSDFAKQFPLEAFINIKILVNKELDEKNMPRYKFQCAECQKDPEPASDSDEPDFLPPATKGSGGEVTTRYVFDTEEAGMELDTVRKYFEDDFDVFEVEGEEEIPPDSPPPPGPPRDQQHPRGPRGPRGPGGGGGGARGRRGPGGPPRGGSSNEPFPPRGPRGPGGGGGGGNGPPRGPGGGGGGPGPRGPGGDERAGGGRDRGGHNGNWRPRNRQGNRRRRD